MKSKPWEKSQLLDGSTDGPVMEHSLKGVLDFINTILSTEEWRKAFFTKHFPKSKEEIERNIDSRSIPLRLVKTRIENFRADVSGPGSEEQEAQAFEMVLWGMLINRSSLMWLAHQAEKATASPVGSIGNTVRKQDWASRQLAIAELDKTISSEPAFANRDQTARDKEAARRLGISLSSVKNWRKGRRR